MHYIRYSRSDEVSSLNSRSENPDVVGVFPRNIYVKHPFSGIRDHSTHYNFTPGGQQQHTPWFSRFSYNRAPNEYGVGVQSRGYIEPAECACNAIPKGMSPARFYR